MLMSGRFFHPSKDGDGSMSKQKRSSFIMQGTILAAAAMITKVIGLALKAMDITVLFFRYIIWL